MKRLVVTTLLMALAGCNRLPVEGEVVGKRFDPAHVVMAMMPVAVPNGNGGVTTTVIPYNIHHPDAWYLWVEVYDETGTPVGNRRVRVTREVYEGVSEGVWFKMTDDKADTTPTRKVRAE